MPYLPYDEPGITVILSLTSLLFLLNIVRYVLDQLLYCGIIGEILIGIIWGLPVGGTAWLTEGMQETIQAFGYLGLIGLVFEGGLSTDISLLRKTAFLSVSVATVGLLMPIALSFLLLVFPFPTNSGIMYPSPLAGFSAGASLCSTSLGTTFAILSSANMQNTRVGVVLVGAAMMDDIVGLVMVNIITTLGNGGTGAWPIVRPIAASFGLLLVTLAVSPYLLKPLWQAVVVYCDQGRDDHLSTAHESRRNTFQKTFSKLVHTIPHLSFIFSTLVLVVFVTIASFIDASVLFAAFIGGGLVNFLWSGHQQQQGSEALPRPGSTVSEMYEDYYKSPINFILAPFFFASIGFSIPITDMLKGSIVWKGIVYSILMAITKGLVSFAIYIEYFMKKWRMRKPKPQPQTTPLQPTTPRQMKLRPQPTLPQQQSEPHSRADNAPGEHQEESIIAGPPHSMALLVGFAMVARGEIGFLIASLSQSSGTLTLRHRNESTDRSSGEDVFLVIIWAVVICTITGPVAVGILVRRLRNRED